MIPLCQALELAECGACSRFRQHQDHLVIIVIIISIIIIIIFCSPVATSRSPPPTHSQLAESLFTMAACSVWCVPMFFLLVLWHSWRKASVTYITITFSEYVQLFIAFSIELANIRQQIVLLHFTSAFFYHQKHSKSNCGFRQTTKQRGTRSFWKR